MNERVSRCVEIRSEGRRLIGTPMVYGDISESHKERFESGSIRLADAVVLNREHNAMQAVAWHPDGGLELRDGPDALEMIASLPPIPAADRAIEDVKSGRVDGLSVEFHSIEERTESGIRVIEQAHLVGVGLVRSPSYSGARAEVRRRSGFTMRARIPANRKVACRCSGVTCKFARITGEAMDNMIKEAFEEVSRETVAGFGSYSSMPLGSTSRGTVRGRILPDGDGEIDIDLPDDATGRAVLAANESAGVISRPVIDADLAESIQEGDTMIYTKSPIRAVSVSATDQREGWPDVEIIPTPEEIMKKEPRTRRRIWL